MVETVWRQGGGVRCLTQRKAQSSLATGAKLYVLVIAEIG